MRQVPQAAGRALFVDSSAFYALRNKRDVHHPDARRVMVRAANEGLALVTTNFVIAEAHALFLARSGREAAVRFLRELEGSSIKIERATVEDEERARSIIYSYTDKNFSLVDAISFAMMERLGLSTAFAFDRNFLQYGFEGAGLI